jgi:UDP-N-acetylmuramoylalanine--D-glutamate ligase
MLVPGEHNLLNATISIAVTHTFGINSDTIQNALETFTGVPERQEFVGQINRVEIINDTTSTMPTAMISALNTFDEKPIHLICGGENKNLSYQELEQYDFGKLKSIFLLPGSASELIFERVKQYSDCLYLERVLTLEEAISKALEKASPGDRMLFSPGATSFGQFQNEFHRGKVFMEIISRHSNYEAK